MEKIELEIVALSHSMTQSHSYAVVLGEVKGQRRLPIVIGGFEAQAIAVALERMQPSRPLTHDLFTNFMTTYGIELHEVIIYKLEEGIFYAKLLCNYNNQITEIDSRTSDALALAARANCKIYTYKDILDNAGMFMEQPEIDAAPKSTTSQSKVSEKQGAKKQGDDLKKLSLEELNTLLQKVLEQEDYAKAISIRDEINNRK